MRSRVLMVSVGCIQAARRKEEKKIEIGDYEGEI